MVMLALRAEYEKSMREGGVDDQGCVTISLESLVIALRNLLGASLPDKKTERMLLFRRLRQLRLVQMGQETDLDQPDAWLRIRPGITGFVSDQVLQPLLDGVLAAVTEQEPHQPDADAGDASCS
jgi:hypothetical protein